MILTAAFLSEFSLYGALIEKWNQVGSDLAAQIELAGFNQPTYRPEKNPETRMVVVIFKEAKPLDSETQNFTIPANGDARVIDQESREIEQPGVGFLELTCELERYPSEGVPGETSFTTLRFLFTGVEIIDAKLT